MAWTTPKTWTTGELVTAADLNTHVRDNLTAVFAPSNFQEAVGSSTDFTTTSTSYVDITGMSVSITTVGGNLLVVVMGHLYTTNISYDAPLAINIDGTDYDAAGSYVLNTTSYAVHVCAFRRFVVSAGAHTVKLRLRTSGGGTTTGFVGGVRRRLTVVEGVL